eukprot:3150521-Lingulodinium_polyedra.AAC.1
MAAVVALTALAAASAAILAARSFVKSRANFCSGGLERASCSRRRAFCERCMARTSASRWP